MCEPRDRRTPKNILTGFAIPLIREILSVGYARSLWATERRPASLGAGHHPRRRLGLPGSGDCASWNYLGFIARGPVTSIQNHLAHPAIVGHKCEVQVLAVHAKFIAPRSIATARP